MIFVSQSLNPNPIGLRFTARTRVVPLHCNQTPSVFYIGIWLLYYSDISPIESKNFPTRKGQRSCFTNGWYHDSRKHIFEPSSSSLMLFDFSFVFRRLCKEEISNLSNHSLDVKWSSCIVTNWKIRIYTPYTFLELLCRRVKSRKNSFSCTMSWVSTRGSVSVVILIRIKRYPSIISHNNLWIKNTDDRDFLCFLWWLVLYESNLLTLRLVLVCLCLGSCMFVWK